MLDLIVRLMVSGAILMSTAQLPAQPTAGTKQTRACPAQWPGTVRTCVA